jgi:translation initiation factor 2 subunit 1
VEIDGEMTITVPGPEGVDVIKDALSKGLEMGTELKNSSVEIYTLGSPRYKLRIVSPDYSEAEDILSSVVGSVTKIIEKKSGNVSFSRN